jgi:hypothetical protein
VGKLHAMAAGYENEYSWVDQEKQVGLSALLEDTWKQFV